MDAKIINTLNKIKTDNLDIKTCKIQLDKIYYTKYTKNFNINIKKYDDIVLVYGIIFKQGVSKPIKFNYNVFNYLLERKNEIYNWISKYKNYNVEENKDNQDNNYVSKFDIFTLLINDYNNNLIIKIDSNEIKSFEHDDIYPYHIRYNNFLKLMNNIVKINKLINDS